MSVPHSNPTWTLEHFVEQLDLWIEREEQAADLQGPVLAWIQSRMDDPYLDVEREDGFDNLWWGRIPKTETSDGLVAIGSYFIFESEKRVECNSFSLISLPL